MVRGTRNWSSKQSLRARKWTHGRVGRVHLPLARSVSLDCYHFGRPQATCVSPRGKYVLHLSLEWCTSESVTAMTRCSKMSGWVPSCGTFSRRHSPSSECFALQCRADAARFYHCSCFNGCASWKALWVAACMWGKLWLTPQIGYWLCFRPFWESVRWRGRRPLILSNRRAS